MEKPLNYAESVVFVGFRQEISSISTRNASNWSNFVEKFENFVVFDAISVEFPRFFVKGSNTIKNERTSFALHFLKRTFQRFVSKTHQNDSK